MKKLWKFSKTPLIVAIIAAILFVIDSLIAPLFIKNASFMWIAFVTWTVFTNSSITDRLTAVPCLVIGFLAAVAMMQFGNLFNVTIFFVSLSSLLGVFLINGLIMFFANLKTSWINIPSIFCGISLTFAGIGQKIYPNSFSDAGIIIGVILVYGVLGLVCGYFTNYFTSLKKSPK